MDYFGNFWVEKPIKRLIESSVEFAGQGVDFGVKRTQGDSQIDKVRMRITTHPKVESFWRIL